MLGAGVPPAEDGSWCAVDLPPPTQHCDPTLPTLTVSSWSFLCPEAAGLLLGSSLLPKGQGPQNTHTRLLIKSSQSREAFKPWFGIFLRNRNGNVIPFKQYWPEFMFL